jgi:membrane protease subunit HflK
MAWNKPGNGNSGNRDPWGSGRGPQRGPPDLDEIVRNIQNRLSGLFGGGKGGGVGKVGIGKAGGIGVGVIIAIVIGLWLLSGLYVVKQAERGVVLRFGELQDVTEAGLHWRLPFPIDSVEKVNVQKVFQMEVGYRSNERTGRVSRVPKEALLRSRSARRPSRRFAKSLARANLTSS